MNCNHKEHLYGLCSGYIIFEYSHSIWFVILYQGEMKLNTVTVKWFHRYRIGTSNCYNTVGSTKVFGNPPNLYYVYGLTAVVWGFVGGKVNVSFSEKRPWIPRRKEINCIAWLFRALMFSTVRCQIRLFFEYALLQVKGCRIKPWWKKLGW